MTISYKTWFSIRLLHEFFNHEAFTDCKLEPSLDTIKTFFTGTTWLQRSINDTLYVLMQENSSGLPALSVPSEKSFRFYLTSNNFLFFNYTDIDVRVNKGYVLYLSNFAGNKIDDVLNLSIPVAAYSSFAAGHIFLPGDLVTEAGIVYESIMQSQNKLPSANDDFWTKRTSRQYISQADALRLSPSNYRYSFTDAIRSFNASVKGFKVSGNTLTEYEVFAFDQSFPHAVKDVQLDLSLLAPGRYKVVLSAVKDSDSAAINKEEIIYYDPAISFKKAFAVVEIFNCIDPANDYALQDNTNKILETNYTISFANRTVWWNYIAKTDAVTGINTTVTDLDFANPDASHKLLFISSFPLPFVKQFDYTPFTVSGPSPPKEIPWPTPAVLKSEKDGSGTLTKYFTEVYINY
jgi:hypothetical protein